MTWLSALDASTLVWLAITVPLVPFVTNMALRDLPNVRDAITFAAALALFVVVLHLVAGYDPDAAPPMGAWSILPGIELAFALEPLGLMFAVIASGLWVVVHVYGIGYMRGNHEKKHARFFASFSIALSATMGIAFSGNLLTLFLFYEVLTVSTYPLVAHKEDDAAREGGRTYLGILLTTSIVFFLTAIVWTYVVAGTGDFRPGGILAGRIDPVFAAVLLGLFVFGIGKAAIMPFHRWLPAAMVAPTPVSALLHAVAVVKAGVFAVLKVGVYVFGIDFLHATAASDWLAWLAAFSIIAASITALTKDNLKARLAYSTVSQLSYITLGMAIAVPLGAMGGALHIATHALGKITLFMCAGAIYVATHRTEISQLDGLARRMPFTFAAFGIGALSIIGVPPLAGAWSKWWLTLGTVEAGQQVLILVFIVSSLLNVGYLLPVFARGFFVPAPLPLGTDGRPAAALGAAATDDLPPPNRFGIAEAPLFCVVPPVLTALGCIVLFFYAGDVADFLQPMLRGSVGEFR